MHSAVRTALQVLLDAVQMTMLAEVVTETAGVEADVGRVLDQLCVLERLLVLEQGIVMAQKCGSPCAAAASAASAPWRA
jgi:hypothetical protein